MKYARKNALKQAETQGKRKYMMNAESQNLCRKIGGKERQALQCNKIKKSQTQENFLQKNESQNVCKKTKIKEKEQQYTTIKKLQAQENFLQNDES